MANVLNDPNLFRPAPLIESYDFLSEFARKHLPDRFVLDGGVRKSAHDIIVQELVSNLLIHREFMSPFPAKLIIDADRGRGTRRERARPASVRPARNGRRERCDIVSHACRDTVV